jgi:1-deoxy-D-xylulose-5-phosphate reductoisomerase
MTVAVTEVAPRRVTILGSTGSVGCNTLDLIERQPDCFAIEALTANRNTERLAEQAYRLRPKVAVIAEPEGYGDLKEALWGTGVDVAAGPDALIEAAERPAEWVMAAIVGAAGLKPTLAAVRRGAVVALANKECLVCAGALMMGEVEAHGATLLPVDSEHNAIFQVLDFDRVEAVEKIILTASGGPFRTRKLDSMANVTPDEAVAHPNWDMGAKISVDSATMMNKGLELIEAVHLFPLSEERIEILVHPESVVHSMVAYVDGSVLAQLGAPDMRTPIAYTLGWPARMSTPAKRLDLAEIGQLNFEGPDPERFPALRLARDALRDGGATPTILNAANEEAVFGFLDKRTGFLDIARIVERTLEVVPAAPVSSLDDVHEVDADARRVARELVAGG